jgi:hypothetical protein
MLKNMVCILGLFGLATVLATFEKNIGRFFSISSGHPASDSSKVELSTVDREVKGLNLARC